MHIIFEIIKMFRLFLNYKVKHPKIRQFAVLTRRHAHIQNIISLRPAITRRYSAALKRRPNKQIMPSCVVKSCKNHSGTIKKSEGITFHRFPLSNDPWKNDWVQIIRESRKESSWKPSKSTVICSIHFEECDLYTTKGGLLRVVTYAVPKKFLHETTTNEVQQSDDAGTSNASYEVPLETVHIKIEDCGEQNFSISTQEYLLTDGESPVPKLVLRQSCRVLPNMDPLDPRNSLPQESSKGLFKSVTSPFEVEMKKPSLYPPKKRHMKERLMKMATLILSQKKKIKILNQKVRRLRDRNQYLKYILRGCGGNK